MYQKSLFENPRGRYTRWYSFENPEGKKGAGAMKNHGHKGDAARVLAPGVGEFYQRGLSERRGVSVSGSPGAVEKRQFV